MVTVGRKFQIFAQSLHRSWRHHVLSVFRFAALIEHRSFDVVWVRLRGVGGNGLVAGRQGRRHFAVIKLYGAQVVVGHGWIRAHFSSTAVEFGCLVAITHAVVSIAFGGQHLANAGLRFGWIGGRYLGIYRRFGRSKTLRDLDAFFIIRDRVLLMAQVALHVA